MVDAFPVFFGTRDTILGNRFVARVSVSGRAVMYQEDGRWWMAGVQPGGIVAAGETPAEAYLAFREAIRNVLHDSAKITTAFDPFRADVLGLLNQVDAHEEQRWHAARAAIRGGAAMPSGGFVGELPRLTTDPAFTAEVALVELADARPEAAPASEVQAAA